MTKKTNLYWIFYLDMMEHASPPDVVATRFDAVMAALQATQPNP